MQQFAQDDKPREWLVQEHDDGIFHISRYVQLFPSPVQRLRGFIQRLFFLYTSLRLLWDFNLSLFQQAPHCFAALAASKAVMALQGAARLYVHALLMKSCQKYLNSEIGEYHLLPILLTVLLLGLVPTVVRHYMLWPRGRIALLCNLEVDSRLMRGFAELREEDREDENVKDLSQEASRLKVGEGGRGGGGGGGGGSRPGGFLGAEEVFGVASKSFAVPLRVVAILRLVDPPTRPLVYVLALFTLFEDRLFLSSAKRLWTRASTSISVTSPVHVRLRRLFEIMTGPHYQNDVQMHGLAPWLLRSYYDVAMEVRQSDAALVGMRRYEIRHEGHRELHIALRHISIAAILIGFTIKHRQQGLQPLTVATWALVQQAAQDLTREVGSIHRDVTHLEDHCRQLSALRAFENVLPKRSARHVVPADRSTKKSEEYEKDKNDLRAEHSPAIEVSNVSFNYPRRTEQVLHNISFNVNRGEMVALVGLNGSSKSTLVKLISGAYRLPADQGCIRINGRDIQGITTRDLSDLVNTLPQRPCTSLLPLTLRENIGLGAHSNDETLLKSAETTGAMDFIKGHPQGLEALLAPAHIKTGRMHSDNFKLFREHDSVRVKAGERVTLIPSMSEQEVKEMTDRVTHRWKAPRIPSGGEAQRIALARAFASEGEVLVLDEPSNNLDVKGTRRLLETIHNNKGKRTLIVIAHHWPGVTDVADRVVLLDKGRLAQSGSHQDLLKEDGPYSKLWGLQVAGQLKPLQTAEGYRSREGGERVRGRRPSPPPRPVI